MAHLTGWHPDPGGAPGRYRYWDGTRWSAGTTDDPGHPAPGPIRPRPPRRPIVAAVVGGLVLLLLLGLAVRSVLLEVRPPDVAPSPPPTATGDDSSPTPTPASPAMSPGSPAPLAPCPVGRPDEREAHPADGRVHGGNLSFPAESSYGPAGMEPRMTFARDVAQQQRAVSSAPGWVAQLAVGRLRAADGFAANPRRTAESLARCVVTGSMYDPYDPTVTERRSRVVTVSSRKGWLVDAEVRVLPPGLAFPGDRAVFVVVPDDADWGFFFGAAPIGDATLNEVLDRTAGALEAT